MPNHKALERAREIAAALQSMEVGGVSGKYRGPYLLRMQDALTDAADLLEKFIESANEPLTNADRIRAMGDEELAEVLAVFQCEGWNMCRKTFDIKGHSIDGHGDNPDILAWLQQPAPEEAEL